MHLCIFHLKLSSSPNFAKLEFKIKLKNKTFMNLTWNKIPFEWIVSSTSRAKLKTNALFPRLQKYQDFQSKHKQLIKFLEKTGGVKDFISSVGSRLVSGDEPEELIGVSKHENPPCFSGHSFDWRKDRSTSSSNIIAQWVVMVTR
jgi:hypothetical protein